MDTLRSQIDVGVRGLCTYSDTLEDDPALHIFANREPFWKNLAALTTANRANESVKARFKAIEDERLAISSQMDASFEGDLKKSRRDGKLRPRKCQRGGESGRGEYW